MSARAHQVSIPGLEGYLFAPLTFEADFLPRETVPETAVAAGRWIGLWGKIHLGDAPRPQKLLFVFADAPGPMSLAFSGIDQGAFEVAEVGPSIVAIHLDHADAAPGATISFLITMTHVAKLFQVLRLTELSPHAWPPRLAAVPVNRLSDVPFEQNLVREEFGTGNPWELVLTLQLALIAGTTDLIIECDRPIDQPHFFLLDAPPAPGTQPVHLSSMILVPGEAANSFRVRLEQPEPVQGERIVISVQSKQMVRVRSVKRVI